MRLTLPIALLCLLLAPAFLLAQELTCPEIPQIRVTTEKETSIVEYCLATRKALDFLSHYNLVPLREIRFEIIDAQIESSGYKAIGSYDSRSDRIRLMSYEAILRSSKQPQMYSEPFDLEHYRGAIAHEVVHAVMQHNLTEKPISIGPQEYVAHATQLAVLPQERRDKIIAAMDVPPWESGDIISDAYMTLEPGKFAVKSYLHLTQMTDPLPFVNVLLNTKWFYVYVP